MTRHLVGAVLLSALTFFSSDVAAQPQFKVTVLNANRVYHPRGLSTSNVYVRTKPGLVDSRAVFDATPEYQKIAKEGIDPNSAEYGILKREASNRFKSAIRKTMSLGGYDLIAETGAVTVAGSQLPDITSQVLQNL